MKRRSSRSRRRRRGIVLAVHSERVSDMMERFLNSFPPDQVNLGLHPALASSSSDSFARSSCRRWTVISCCWPSTSRTAARCAIGSAGRDVDHIQEYLQRGSDPNAVNFLRADYPRLRGWASSSRRWPSAPRVMKPNSAAQRVVCRADRSCTHTTSSSTWRWSPSAVAPTCTCSAGVLPDRRASPRRATAAHRRDSRLKRHARAGAWPSLKESPAAKLEHEWELDFAIQVDNLPVPRQCVLRARAASRQTSAMCLTRFPSCASWATARRWKNLCQLREGLDPHHRRAPVPANHDALQPDAAHRPRALGKHHFHRGPDRVYLRAQQQPDPPAAGRCRTRSRLRRR